jgi:RNA polymerase-binding protein DksA
MDKEILNSWAEILRCRRAELLKEFRQAEDDLEFIAADRESEIEERAQEERSARLLARLDDRTLREVREIDAALQRILDQTYGVCEACGESIAVGRLSTLPETRYCRDCAERNEKQEVTAAEEAALPPKDRVPPDLSLLDDRELVEGIREHLKEDGRIDTEELRIACREGVVYLDGALPSETEHQILVQILTDVLGLKEIVDHVQLEELLWEREDRSKEKPPEELPPWQEAYGTEDIAESSEEDKEFVAPSDPTPKEE